MRDIDNLHLGGPEFCQGSLPSNITFDDKGSPKIEITLCGVPVPKVACKFYGRKVSVLNKKINNYTYNFTLELPQLTKKGSGKTLIVTASGQNGTSYQATKIYAENVSLTIIFLNACFVSFFTIALESYKKINNFLF